MGLQLHLFNVTPLNKQKHSACPDEFFYQLDTASHLERETWTEKMPASDWPIGKPVGYVLD